MFWAPCGSREGADGWGGASGGMGECPPHTCMHMHAHTHTHLYMYRNCKWPPTWRHPCLACLTCMCVRVCMCMRACMGHPRHTHTHPDPHPPIHRPPRGVDPQNHLKFNNISTYQDISIPFKDVKSVKNSPPMGGWLGGSMEGIRSND